MRRDRRGGRSRRRRVLGEDLQSVIHARVDWIVVDEVAQLAVQIRHLAPERRELDALGLRLRVALLLELVPPRRLGRQRLVDVLAPLPRALEREHQRRRRESARPESAIRAEGVGGADVLDELLHARGLRGRELDRRIRRQRGERGRDLIGPQALARRLAVCHDGRRAQRDVETESKREQAEVGLGVRWAKLAERRASAS